MKPARQIKDIDLLIAYKRKAEPQDSNFKIYAALMAAVAVILTIGVLMVN